MKSEIEITVLLFGACRELAATDELSLKLAAGSSVAMAFDELKRRYPELKRFTTRLFFAVNESYATPEQELAAGDTLAILPPVSGGAEGADICELTRDEIDSR